MSKKWYNSNVRVILMKIFKITQRQKELIRMKTQNNYISVPRHLALIAVKERRLLTIKKTSQTIFNITWKALLYAFILTIANVII